MTRTTRSVASALVVLILVAALGFIYASPYIALHRSEPREAGGRCA